MPAQQHSVLDRQLLVYERWDAQQRERLKALITDELMEEHRSNPLGQHSYALQRVLQYLRRQPIAGKYVAVMTKPGREYRIGVLSGVPGEAPAILEGDVYDTEEGVLHGIFARRIRDFTEG